LDQVPEGFRIDKVKIFHAQCPHFGCL